MAKQEIKTKTKKEATKKASKKTKEKVSIFTKISTFINGVKTEFKRIKWPSKKELVKYAMVTIVFVIVCSLFFYIIDIIIAALHSL